VSDRWWAKGCTSANADWCFTGSRELVFGKLKVMLQHQPAVLVQPHLPELFAREFRLVMNAETGRVCVSLMTERRPDGRLTVTDLRPGTERFEAAAALLPALQRCAQLTHALICSKVPMFSTRVRLYRIDLAVLNEDVVVVNEVQCSYDTALFPDDHTWPVMDLQALQTEKIMLDMVPAQQVLSCPGNCTVPTVAASVVPFAQTSSSSAKVEAKQRGTKRNREDDDNEKAKPSGKRTKRERCERP
jgi:hypothetical protein